MVRLSIYTIPKDIHCLLQLGKYSNFSLPMKDKKRLYWNDQKFKK